MKTWQSVLIGSMLGLLFTAVILMVLNPRFDQEPILLPTRAPDTLVVYITGEVNEPGVIQLASNSRIYDAIQKAGGFTEEANQEAVNLAAILEDEDRIVIPSKNGENDSAYTGSLENMISINSASVEELDQLPGVGPVKAQAIVDFREANGAFLSTEDLLQVPGINQDLFQQVERLITVNP